LYSSGEQTYPSGFHLAFILLPHIFIKTIVFQFHLLYFLNKGKQFSLTNSAVAQAYHKLKTSHFSQTQFFSNISFDIFCFTSPARPPKVLHTPDTELDHNINICCMIFIINKVFFVLLCEGGEPKACLPVGGGGGFSVGRYYLLNPSIPQVCGRTTPFTKGRQYSTS